MGRGGLAATAQAVQLRKIDLLRQLQDTDVRIESGRATVARLQAEIGDRRALDVRAVDIEGVRREAHHLEAEQRDLELQVEERASKIAADQQKLYGGRITSPKELGSLQDEVAQDRRQLSAVEDKLLEVLERAETLSQRLADLERSFAEESAAWVSAQEAARTRQRDTEAALVALGAQRAQVAAQMEPEEASTYESLRRQKGGMAVAQVQQRTCQACRVSLTPAQEQRARIGAGLVTCHSCGRLLFVPLS
jgi:predicted  nucleic acid-binding Zn-ribbon protein